MQPRTQRTGRTGRPPRLALEAILAAAQRILDQEGAENLSMRRLAKEMSSTPMALYHYVRDKDELLLLLLEEHAAKFPRPGLPTEPRARLLASAQVLHDILVGCPWIVEVVASDDLFAVSAMWIVENILDAAIGCGMTPEDAVYAYRVIWYYTAGELTVRFNRERRQAHLDRPPHRDQIADLDPEEFPNVTSLGGQWVELTTRDTHRRGLEAVVAGLLAQAS
ncbi:TetR family transcriptional regulator [Streptomyces rapamycinicus]|nr:TetR family transcriptional regulator [Streptomyces rapamycinicus]MBB4781074.1 AcrR family transcriptional regulator [Streptomyces rapamycinicus]UTO61732.1 TetR/AcrR family transcriptional regulator C-terminal domain-containing protein [Streptomyces rapamycinicus]UTP29685.1 TetR/AcrR family transcriptional regulator C-terminal domain-containing protein [Streptomyces rapamycinicus NRRL 5491]